MTAAGGTTPSAESLPAGYEKCIKRQAEQQGAVEGMIAQVAKLDKEQERMEVGRRLWRG